MHTKGFKLATIYEKGLWLQTSQMCPTYDAFRGPETSLIEIILKNPCKYLGKIYNIKEKAQYCYCALVLNDKYFYLSVMKPIQLIVLRAAIKFAGNLSCLWHNVSLACTVVNKPLQWWKLWGRPKRKPCIGLGPNKVRRSVSSTRSTKVTYTNHILPQFAWKWIGQSNSSIIALGTLMTKHLVVTLKVSLSVASLWMKKLFEGFS